MAVMFQAASHGERNAQSHLPDDARARPHGYCCAAPTRFTPPVRANRDAPPADAGADRY